MHRWKAEIMRTGYHDDFRLSVILNYLFMVMIPFLILMAVFLIYFTWSATNSYGESTGKLIESEQKRLNAQPHGARIEIRIPELNHVGT